MPDVPPASATSSSASSVAPSSNNIVVETTVNSVPDKIQQLARQIEVSGMLAGAPAGNTITLNTLIGPLVLVLPQLVQAQQEKLLQQLMGLFQNQRPLTVVMQPGNPPSQAFLLLPPNQPRAVNFPSALAPQTAASLSTTGMILSAIVLPKGAGSPFVTTGQAGQVPYASLNPNANSNSGLTATLNQDVASNPLTAVASAEQMIERLEATLAGDVLAKLTRGIAPGNMPETSPPSTGAPNIPPPANAPAGAAAPTLFQVGAELNLRVDAVILPLPNAPQIPPLQTTQILATVVGGGPGGQIILKAGDTSMFIRQPVNLPVGTQLVVTAELAKTDTPALLTLPDVQEFSALQQAIAALAQIDPGIARATVAARLPQANAELPGTLLFFLSAIRQGDVRSWLGNNAVDLLTHAGKMELIAKLMQEFQQSEQTVRDNMVGEWRSYTVPLHDNNQFSVLHFYVHGDRERHAAPHGGAGGGKTEASNQVRFLIDIRMSRLGAMQLDGFLRPQRLDIIMRSENRLPPGLDSQLRASYTRTLEAIGYSGAINFQTGRQGWLTMQKPASGGRAITT